METWWLARIRRALTEAPRHQESGPGSVRSLEIPDTILSQVESVPVPANLIGVSLAESSFRERFGVAVLLILRVEQDGKQHRLIPMGSTRFGAADRLIVFGSRDKIKALGQSDAVSPKAEPAV